MNTEIAVQTLLIRDLTQAGVAIDIAVPAEEVDQLITNSYGASHHDVVKVGSGELYQAIYETVVEDFVTECRLRGITQVFGPEVVLQTSLSGVEYCVRGYIPSAVPATV